MFNTCAVRENAADRLYGNLGHLYSQKKKGMQIAVGGCLAQMERTRITERAPWVDVVYGTHNMGSLPALLERARVRNEAQAEFAETLETFPSLLPARRQSAYAAWVAISVGCNNTCTFCIVPSLRGREKDRRPGDILDEIRALVANGVIEVTLLGQNVNSYGAEFGDRQAFGKLLRACGQIEGLERVRFTSPHPRDFTDDVIDAMAETANVMPSLHMPLQSGSDCRAEGDAPRLPPGPLPGDPGPGPGQHPRRRHHDRHHRRLPRRDRPGLRGHPGPGAPGPLRRRVHLQVLHPPRHPGGDDGRPGPAPTVQERFERLTALVEETTYAENRKLAGTPVEVLVAEGEGRKDAVTHRMSGRARDNRLVHFTPLCHTAAAPRPGDLVTAAAAPARSRAPPRDRHRDRHPGRPALPAVRRRAAIGPPHPAGDAWEAAATAPAAAAPSAAAGPLAAVPVLLGMPARHPSA